MRSLTVFEIHSLSDSFADGDRDRYSEILKDESDEVIQVNDKRMVGKISSCGEYPYGIKKSTKEANIVIILCSIDGWNANTLVISEGLCKREFNDDSLAEEAISYVKKEHGIDPYIDNIANEIPFESSMFTEESSKTGIDGTVSVRRTGKELAEIVARVDGERKVVAKVNRSEVNQLIREMKAEVDKYDNHKQ